MSNTQKNKPLAAVLALFLGGLGIHLFYLGQTKRGALYLIFCWTFVPAIVGIWDFLQLAMMDQAVFDYRYNGIVSAAESAIVDPMKSAMKAGLKKGILKALLRL